MIFLYSTNPYLTSTSPPRPLTFTCMFHPKPFICVCNTQHIHSSSYEALHILSLLHLIRHSIHIYRCTIYSSTLHFLPSHIAVLLPLLHHPHLLFSLSPLIIHANLSVPSHLRHTPSLNLRRATHSLVSEARVQTPKLEVVRGIMNFSNWEPFSSVVT